MKYSLSFLATDPRQLPQPSLYGNNAIEAVLFNRSHLSAANTKKTWQNIEEACKLYGPENVTFHFPMNECDYSEDKSIYRKLRESFVRATEMGLSGVVVHSNRIATCKIWNQRFIEQEKKKIFDLLVDVRTTQKNSNTWLGLENMPVVGNDGYETDPLFCTAQDFIDLPEEIGIVWDVCHATASQYFTRLAAIGKMPLELFVRRPIISDFEIKNISHRIVHAHFAASKGYNNLLDKKNIEGVLPSESDITISIYEQAYKNLIDMLSVDTIVNFEVQETDYINRINGPKIISWAKQIY